jgi:excisionase family DNA binding protein
MSTAFGDEKLLRLSEASAKLNISYWTMREWCRSGKCRYHRPGKFLLISQTEISRLLQESQV